MMIHAPRPGRLSSVSRIALAFALLGFSACGESAAPSLAADTAGEPVKDDGWYPHEGGLLRFRAQIRFGEELVNKRPSNAMPEGWEFGRVSAVASDSEGNVYVFHRGPSADPIVVFGASGRGKSTLVKTVLLTMAAQHSPHLLHMYALDFGRGGLKGIRALPHLGASIDASQPERVEQLFRMLRGMMNERQERLAKFASIEDYNAQFKDQPEFLFPAPLVRQGQVKEEGLG